MTVKSNFKTMNPRTVVLCRMIRFSMIVQFHKTIIRNSLFLSRPSLKRAARPRSRTRSSSRGRGCPRSRTRLSSIEDEVGKNQLLADRFGLRSIPRYEMDRTCMTHSQVSCPAFQIHLELSEIKISVFSQVLVKSGQSDPKVMVKSKTKSRDLILKTIFSKPYYSCKYRHQI